MVILAAICLVIAHPGPVFYAGDKGPGADDTWVDSRGRSIGTTKEEMSEADGGRQ